MTDATARKYDKMADALADYARENDQLSASDCQTEGYLIAAEAVSFPEGERADYIDTEAQNYPESARYLIAVSADYRLAELVARDDAYPWNAEIAA
jgi:hypothetical protein